MVGERRTAWEIDARRTRRCRPRLLPARGARAAICALVLLLAACSSDDAGGDRTSDDPVEQSAGGSAGQGGEGAEPVSTCVDTSADADDPRAADIVATAQEVAEDLGLAAVVLRVEQGGDEIVTAAFGESLRGVPATPADRFWNGAAVFTYLGTVVLQLDEEGALGLDEPIAPHLPDVPSAEEITPRMLLASTAGFVDYVALENWVDDFYADPFHPFTLAELETYVYAEPLLFEPGTAVGYSHLNFQLVGALIEEVTGEPLADVLAERVLEPLGLDRTESLSTADVPRPRLHTFTDERGMYEDSSSWSPAWGVPEGAAMITDVCDLAAAAVAIGSGTLITDESYAEMVDPYPGGLEPPEDCDSCIPVFDDLHLGLGVVVAGDWVIQSPLFTGIAGVQAYLPSDDLAIALGVTYADGADVGVNGATEIFKALAPQLAPDAPLPPQL